MEYKQPKIDLSTLKKFNIFILKAIKINMKFT